VDKRIFSLCIGVILLFSWLTLSLVKAETGKITEIEIRADGSAQWIIDEKFPLETSDNDIQIAMSSFENFMEDLIENAEVQTGRSMEMLNFSGSGPVTYQDYKKVRYEIEWSNFAELKSNRIIIGDVFEAGLMDLSTNADVLTIKYPSNYKTVEVVPTPSQTSDCELTWYGPKSFSNGEPTIILKSVPSPWLLLGLATTLIGAIVVGWFLWFKKLFKPMLKASKKQEPVTPREPLKSDTEKIIDILKESGGKASQKEIVKQMDLSKSKVSMLLSALEGKGVVERIQMGRRKVVILKEVEEKSPEKEGS